MEDLHCTTTIRYSYISAYKHYHQSCNYMYKTREDLV